jgi:Raf kinase inhibitor-like YbhB/YbcL family protein
MPNPGTHHYDVERSRLRNRYEQHGVPDQHADRAANKQLERDNPPQPQGWRTAGPPGNTGISRGDPSIDEPQPPPEGGGIELRSAAFNDHTLIPDRYSAEGDNISPPLEWSQPPDGTEELALVCEDPDAPGGTFVHWVLSGIPAGSRGMEQGTVPDGAVAGRNDFGELGWGGPRPPVGDDSHRYFFRLYAADRPLGLREGATAADLRSALDGHELALGNLVGLFGR